MHARTHTHTNVHSHDTSQKQHTCDAHINSHTHKHTPAHTHACFVPVHIEHIKSQCSLLICLSHLIFLFVLSTSFFFSLFDQIPRICHILYFHHRRQAHGHASVQKSRAQSNTAIALQQPVMCYKFSLFQNVLPFLRLSLPIYLCQSACMSALEKRAWLSRAGSVLPCQALSLFPLLVTHRLNTNTQVRFTEARGEKQVSLQGTRNWREGRDRKAAEWVKQERKSVREQEGTKGKEE